MGRDLTRWEIVSCMMLTTSASIVFLVCMILFIGLLFTSFWYIPVAYLVWWFYDRNTPYRDERRFSFMRNLFLWKHLANYFPIKLHKTADLDPSKNYLFAFHPHGMAVYGAFVNFATNETGFDSLFPGITVHLLTVSGQFKVPFYRDYVMSAGLGSVSAESIDYKLTKIGPGHSVLIVTGGAAELLLNDPSVYKLKLQNRKGFVRRALKTGACLVPVFSFSEQRVFDVFDVKKGSFSYYIQRMIKLLFGLEVPLDVRGRPGFAGFVPKRIPIDTVVGAPLDFTDKVMNKSFQQEPPEELVDECHKIYLEALRKLYDENKARFGDADTPLIFV